MKLFVLLLSVFLLAKSVHSDDADKLFKVFIDSPEDAKLMHQFRIENSAFVDLWSEPRVNSQILAQLKADTFEDFKKLGFQYKVVHENITQKFEQSLRSQQIKENSRKIFYSTLDEDTLADHFELDQYHSYNEIVDYMKSMTRKSSGIVGVGMFSIGQTAEGRNIHGLSISKESLVQKKIFLLECGIHAREWVSGSACLKMINKFVLKPDDVANNILNKYDVHIIPILNPDGFEYSRTKDRSWRKNRSKNLPLVPFCRGTDLNRNFDVEFGGAGVDPVNPCSLIYCGKAPFSENETRALRDYLESIKKSLHVYVSLHSFSQLILYPYGAKKEIPENNDELKRLATLAQDAIYSKQGEIYKAGNIYTAIYPASGSSLDWIDLNTDCKYNFCFEMRDTGEHGFLLPEELIEPAFMDIWIGIEQLILNLRD